jgi:hypothetical protein
VRSPVSPGLASDRRLAPFAGFIGLSVGVKLLGKVACFPVDVLVLLVKGGPTLLYGRFQHLLGYLNKFGQFGLRYSIGRAVKVKLGQPEGFISINIANSTN